GVPELDGAVLAGAEQALAVGAVGDGPHPVGVAEAAVAEDAGDVGGEVGGQPRQFPEGLAEAVAGLDEPAGRQGGVAGPGEAVGAAEPLRREDPGEAGPVGGGALGPELWLGLLDGLGAQAAAVVRAPRQPPQ